MILPPRCWPRGKSVRPPPPVVWRQAAPPPPWAAGDGGAGGPGQADDGVQADGHAEADEHRRVTFAAVEHQQLHGGRPGQGGQCQSPPLVWRGLGVEVSANKTTRAQETRFGNPAPSHPFYVGQPRAAAWSSCDRVPSPLKGGQATAEGWESWPLCGCLPCAHHSRCMPIQSRPFHDNYSLSQIFEHKSGEKFGDLQSGRLLRPLEHKVWAFQSQTS